MANPFSPVSGLTIEIVDSAAGSQKTRKAITAAIRRVHSDGAKILFVQPSLLLIKESIERANRASSVYERRYKRPPVPIFEITSNRSSESAEAFGVDAYDVTQRVVRHLTGFTPEGKRARGVPSGGHLVFITHQTFLGLSARFESMSPVMHVGLREFEVVIDEVLPVILTRPPFALHYSWRLLTCFLNWRLTPPSPMAMRAFDRERAAADAVAKAWAKRHSVPEPPSARNTPRDERVMRSLAAMADASNNASAQEQETANAKLVQLRADIAAHEQAAQAFAEATATAGKAPPKVEPPTDYYNLARNSTYTWKAVTRRFTMAGRDEGYRIVSEVARWLSEGAMLFSRVDKWDGMQDPGNWSRDRGKVTISGFRRPDFLKRFKRITLMSALLRHTMLYHLWSELGVEWRESLDIPLAIAKTSLGRRSLRIYWLTDQGWSKRRRDASGGIDAIFELIKKAGVISETEPVAVLANKDDADENNPGRVRQHFPHGVVLPHSSYGQNRFRNIHALIHVAALNAYTADIRWMEQMLGIGSDAQRIARTGHDIYQAMMRLSLRVPQSTHDVSVVVMDRDVAEWLVQWFEPSNQIEVIEIDSSGVIKRKGKPGAPPLGERAMTGAERARRWRLAHAPQRAASSVSPAPTIRQRAREPSVEWYTPRLYADAVHEVFGGPPDLDPASCELANRTIKARHIYTIGDDGYIQPWFGKVFLNPPYGLDENWKSKQGKWITKLIAEFDAGRIDEAIMLLAASTGKKWFQKVWEYPVCFVGAIQFSNPDGKKQRPAQGNVFVYLGPNVDRFVSVFSKFGRI